MKSSKFNKTETTMSQDTESSVPTKEEGQQKSGARKFNRRARRQGMKAMKNEAKKFFNDPEFYRHNPELIEAAAKLPFGLPAGNSINLTTYRTQFNADASGTHSQTSYTDERGVPGILVVRMLPSIGDLLDSDGSDPIDVAAKAIYSWIRHANSGSTNYDSPDMMLYLLAMREVYAFAGWLIRLYSAMLYVDPANRYTQAQLVYAMGGDYDDLKINLPNLLYYINFFFKRVDALAVPALPLFKKAFSMFTKVFVDDSTGKGQFYLYQLQDVMYFDETTGSHGGCLLSLNEDWGGNTFDHGMVDMNTIRNIGERLLQPLLDSEDIGIMSGDIRKAYSQLFTLGTFAGTASLMIEHNAFDLQIIHNLNRVPFANHAQTIFQDANGRLLQFYTFQNKQTTGNYLVLDTMATADKALFDIDSEVPTTDEIIETSLYKNHVVVYANSVTNAALAQYATECATAGVDGPVAGRAVAVLRTGADYICNYCEYIQFTHGPLSPIIVLNDNQTADNVILSGSTYFVASTAFDWAPYYDADYYAGALAAYGTPVGAYHNYSLVSWEVVNRLHTTIWMSLLGVPIH